MIDFTCEEQHTLVPSIKVIGVGGAGGNTVNSLVESGCQGIHCIAANTDAQALEQSYAQQKIQLGVKATKGLGTGANPDIGKHAAEEDIDKIMQALGNADIVFLTAGMGGGTGSGALPVVAQALKEEGILTIAIITTPFTFEGKRRMSIARQAIEKLQQVVDALIVIPNEKLLGIVDQEASLLESFAMINDMLSQSVKGIADIITKPGYINVDFADLKAVMKGMGLAVMGTGRATGEGRASAAAVQAINSQLLENMTIKGARGVLLNISGGPSMRLHEINEAASIIYQQAAEDAHIIVGAVIDETLQDDIAVTVIATGFEKSLSQSCSDNMMCGAHVIASDVAADNLNDGSEFCASKTMEAVRKYEEPLAKERFHADKDQDAVALHGEDLDDLDVPTFMRKQADQDNP